MKSGSMKLGFIGTGNMAGAIMGGIIKNKIFRPEEIIGADISPAGRERAKETYGICVTDNNREAAEKSEVLILSVKPQYYADAIAEIRDCISDDQLIITIAPGKTLAWLEEQFGKAVKIVRTMPNTPALVGEGMTAACVNQYVTEEEKEYALKILSSFGKVEIVAEHRCSRGSERQLPGLCVHVYRGDGGCRRSRGDAKAAGVPVRGAGSLRQREDGTRDGKTSGRIKRYGMLPCGNDHRSSQSPRGEGIPQRGH